MFLFLDDMRMPEDVKWVPIPDAQWNIVRNFDQFVEFINAHGAPTYVAFDHDLADEHYGVQQEHAADADYGTEKTGYDCAKWLVEYCHNQGCKFPEFVVHSMNPVGSARIKNYIEDARKHFYIG